MKALEEAKRLIAEIERRNLALEPDSARALLQESGPRVLRALVAEVERLQRVKAAAQRFILASGDDCGLYSEEQQAWDALDEALTEACT